MRTSLPIPVYLREVPTYEEMERVVAFVRESCERDALPEWLTNEVIERFKFEFVSDPRYQSATWADQLGFLKRQSEASSG